MPIPGKSPMLTTLFKYLQSNGCSLKDELELAEQLAPALGIYGGWIEPALVDSGNSWKEAKIEYEQYFAAKEMSDGNIYAIKDVDGYIRHLICENYADGKVCILPMTFAQHPNYRTPLVCHFIFSSEWWLMGSEQLKLYPEAEVLITNELHCQNSNPAADRIFLRYFFGKEMIPYLRLECLKSRNVKILLNMTSNKLEMRNNLEETILLMARLKELDIKAEIMQINDAEPLNPENSDSGLPNVVFHCKPEKVGIEKIVTLGISYGIKIPENLRPDRYGALWHDSVKPLVNDFLYTSAVTTLTMSSGTDLSLITTSIIAGLKKGQLFSGKWDCCHQISPICFIQPCTVSRHNALFKQLSADKFTFYELPCGKKEDIESRLGNIVKENGSDVFLFEAREIVSDCKKELKIACEWAIKNRLGVVIITSQEDRAAEEFFADISFKNIYVWRTGKKKNEYIIEDRPLLIGDPVFFKIMYSNGGWSYEDVELEEICEIPGRNVIRLQEEEEMITTTNNAEDRY